MKRFLRVSLLLWLILAQVGSLGYWSRSSHALMTCEGLYEHVAPPLIDLQNDEYMRLGVTPTGVMGGLYPEGSNERPLQHEDAGLRQAAQIQPLDANGNVDVENGRVIMITIGMSNTDQESKNFVVRVRDDKMSGNGIVQPNFFVVNGAEPGQSADKWVDVDDPNWQTVKDRLPHLAHGGEPGLTAQQVQVVWVKQTHPMHDRTTAFPDHVEDLQADLEQIARNIMIHFPNVKIAYFTSRARSYAYWDGTPDEWGYLTPEPAAFESGFAVKWMIEKQINRDSSLNFEPTMGPVVAPYLAWGPYIWVDSSPRSDGFVWTPDDLEHDCTHPSPTGEEKVGQALFDFFSSDSTAVSWFTGGDIDPPTLPDYLQYLPLVFK